MEKKYTQQALNELKVVDFGIAGVNPMTTKFLADHGATVVRIESHTRPDIQRLGKPFKDNIPGINRSGLYANCNTSKYSATLDLTKPRGKEVALRFIKWADIVCEGMVPGTMKRLGLDYESIRSTDPGVIFFSTSQQGQYGPRSKFGGFGFQACAISGIFHLVGWPDRAPGGLYGAYTDWINPPLGVAAILAALDHRRRTGKGQYIDQSQLEGALLFFAPIIMDYATNGSIMKRNGDHLPCASPHGAYPCKGDDSWIAIAIFNDKEWATLCNLMGKPELLTDIKFSTLKARKGNEDELDCLIGEWTQYYTAEQLMTMLQSASIASGPIRQVKDLFNDPQLKYRSHFRWLNHSGVGYIACDGPAFKLSKTPDSQFAAPALGEHNEYVYKELLGLSDDEITDLILEHVITTESDLSEYRVM